MSKRILVAMFLVGMLILPSLALAQAGGGGGGRGGGMGQGGPGMPGGPGGANGPNGRGNFDPIQSALDNARLVLNCTDDEWKVIEPKLRKVIETLQSIPTISPGRGNRGRGNPGGPGGRGNATTDSAVTLARTDLQTSLDNAASPPTEINQKLKVYRDARDRAEKALSDAQKDLQAVLTARQEASLVTIGYLK